MELKNIFKMEMFKNSHDKPYLIVIAILTVMAALASFLGILTIKNWSDNYFTSSFVLLILLVFFTVLGLGVFSLLYPFHLLNTDYKNKVMSLIFASGVSREKYYFVKISATILTCFIATFVVLFIPIVTFLVIYPEFFVEMMRNIIDNFSFSDILPFLFSMFFGMLAFIVTLTTSVIITKGKISGIFLYFAFSFVISAFQTSIIFPLIITSENHSTNMYINVGTVFSIIQIIVFVLIGLQVLKRQDL
jgi:hypothetical protein